MKKLIIKAAAVFSILNTSEFQSQISIGKDNVTNESVLLEFSDENKGFVLPSLISAPGAAVGTFIYNTEKNSVMLCENYFNGIAYWKFLTPENMGQSHSFVNQGNDIGNGVIIGSSTSSKPGILVLESTKKAMVLPKASNPHIYMKGTIAGTIVYDTASDMLAIYNGKEWYYWN